MSHYEQSKAPGRIPDRPKATFRTDPAWWAWAVVALIALVPIVSVILQLDYPAMGTVTFSFSAHG
jgi:hypothetical protein